MEVQRSSRPAAAASSRQPPLTGTHGRDASCVRAVSSWLPAPEQRRQQQRVIPSGLSRWVWSALSLEREHRDIVQSGEAALNLEGLICVLDAWGLGRKSRRKLQAFLTPAVPAGARAAPAG